MSKESDTEFVRRYFEVVWNADSAEAAKALVHDNYTSIENLVFASTPGPQIVAAEMQLYRSLYDGLNFKIERVFSEGNTIVTVWQASGTSKTETFVNRKGDPQAKTLEAEGVSLTEVKDGKIAAHRFLWPRRRLSP
jgi:ketosteroid isomerase-like protein